MLNARSSPHTRGDRRIRVPDRIAGWAARRPDAVALVDGERTVSYGELGRRMDALAGELRRLGVRPDDTVAVYLERSADCVVAAAAVLAAGAAYLMLDVHQPDRWTHRLLAQSRARVVITREGAWAGGPEAVRALDVAVAPVEGPSPSPVPAGNALAYLSFTSGSTGAPKGVLVEHAALANMVGWYLDRYGVGPGDRLTQLARPAFDAFALEVWPCLSGGATLHIVEPALLTSPEELTGWLRRTGITVAFVPTPLAEQLLELPWPAGGDSRLRDMLVGGDRLSGHPPAGLPFRLHNNYGPTECTVVATCCEVPAGDGHVAPPIGEPIWGITAHVLDQKRRPVADGEPGELHLGGVGVARGYVGADTAGPGPFWSDPFSGRPGARLYATGDLVRRGADGQLHFLGRIDDQVQVRGFRVEPAEIESALLRHPCVGRAAVVPRRDGDGQIVAYVVARDHAADRLDPSGVRRFLTAELPDYMVPATIVPVDELPVTANGKLNRRALADRPIPGGEGTDPIAGPSAVEHALSELWAEVLNVSGIGPGDSFFDIGGDSLLVIRLISKARRRGMTLRPEDVYSHPVLRELAQLLDGRPTTNERNERVAMAVPR